MGQSTKFPFTFALNLFWTDYPAYLNHKINYIMWI